MWEFYLFLECQQYIYNWDHYNIDEEEDEDRDFNADEEAFYDTDTVTPDPRCTYFSTGI